MTDTTPFMAEAYEAALQEYLAGAKETALARAYDLGRRVNEQGQGVLDVVALHHHTLANVLRMRITQAANDLLAESLAPFEMTHRGFREANAELREAREFLEKLVASSPMLIYTVVPGSFQVSYLSPNINRLLGYSLEEVTGASKSVLDFVHPEDRARILASIAEMVEVKAQHSENEFRLMHRDGTPRWFHVVGRAEYDEAGAPSSFFGYGVDVTERKQVEEALQEQRETLQAIIESSPDAVTLLALDGTIRFVSPAISEVIGYTSAERIGEHTYDNVHPDDREQFTQALQQTIATGRPGDIRVRRRHANGQWVIIESRLRRLCGAAGQPSGILVVSRNVTEAVRFDEALQEAKAAAERADQAKSEFLSRMSHELRTPLNAILGFAQLLETDDPRPEQQERLGYVRTAGLHLLQLINEVLDIARVEAGRLTLSLEPVHVGEALGDAVNLVRTMAAERQVFLGGDVPETVDLHVLADRQRLKQILLNLLSNAIRYNRPGGTVTIACDQTQGERLRINVIDTGYGISKEKLDRLFVPFERLGAEQTEIEGTGLGLALSKRLVEAMDGSIGVHSEAGRGSTFWVELPLTESPLERVDLPAGGGVAPAAPEAPLESRTVLYVEDNLSNLRLIEHVFRDHPGIKLLSAMQGQIGLDLARERTPDLILVDLHLPDIPGDEVLRRLQADARTRGIPVVVISADATPGQAERLRAAGAYAYLTKPFDVERFLEVLDTSLKAKAG